MTLSLPVPAIVVDASAAVELLLGTPAGRRVARLLTGATAAAPAHLDAEVLSALGRLVRDGTLDDEAVSPRLSELARAPIARFAIAPLLTEAWSLRQNLSLRDALFVALARRLDATLLTADARLSRAPSLGIAVALVSGPE